MSFELIESQTTTSTVSQIEFTSIPQDGKDLVVYMMVAGAGNQIQFKVNNQTGYYHSRSMGSNTSTTGFSSSSAQTNIYVYNIASGSTNAASMRWHFSRYADTTMKLLNYDGATSTSGGSNAAITSPEFGALATSGTAAITSIQFISPFTSGSTISLYKTY